MIEANGVELCTESFGRPTDPAIVMIMGIGGSMLVGRRLLQAAGQVRAFRSSLRPPRHGPLGHL